MLDELALAEDWGLLQFVPHERGRHRRPAAGSCRDVRGQPRRPRRLAPHGHARRPAVRRPGRAARHPRDRRAARRSATRPRASPGARAVRRPGQPRRALRGRARVPGRAGRDGRHGQGHRPHHQRPAQPRRACSRPASSTLLDGFRRQRLWIKTVAGRRRVADRSTCPTTSAFAAAAGRSWPSPSSSAALLLAPAGRHDGRRRTTRCRPRWTTHHFDHVVRAAPRHRDVARWSSSPSAPARSAWAAWC